MDISAKEQNEDKPPEKNLVYNFLEEPLQEKPVREDDFNFLSQDVDSDLEEELCPYLTHALNALSFHIDMLGDEMKFRPIMAHQIFDQREIIQGYKNLKVTIKILPNSFHAKLDIAYEDAWKVDSRGYYPDDIPEKLKEWFPHIVPTHEYEKLKLTENYSKMFGTVITEFIQEGLTENSKLFINVCNGADPDFMSFHKRFQALIVFFIDAASIIDFDDSNWNYFYIYKKFKKENTTCYIPIGFCTVYLFPIFHKARISQFFILPLYQKQGFGTRLLGTVYKYYMDKVQFKYLTVESPGDNFVVMRDKLELQLVAKLPEFSETSILGGFCPRMKDCGRITCKMSPEQTRRVFTILLYYYSRNSPMLNTRFIHLVKKGVHNTYRKRLSRLPISSGERCSQLKNIVADDFLKNRFVSNKTKTFVRTIEPQILFLSRFFSD